jgi:hypothetical protein
LVSVLNNLKYNENRTLRTDLSADDKKTATDNVKKLSTKKSELERAISNAKGAVSRSKDEMKYFDNVRSELKTLREA